MIKILILRRVQVFNECERCTITGRLITWGEYYYQDDTDGFIVGLDTYYDMKLKHRQQTFDYTRLQEAQNERQYINELRKAESNLFTQTLFDREIAGGTPYENY